MIGAWSNPADQTDELAICFDRGREQRLLVVPALFDEGNKLRKLTVEVMRRLDKAGIDCFLPDLPGTNESAAALETQTLDSWRSAMLEATNQFSANKVLSIRGGALLAPQGIAALQYAAVSGAKILRTLIRARIIASREAGQTETQDGLFECGRTEGLALNGYKLAAGMVAGLESAEPILEPSSREIPQSTVGGAGLWLRAEPDFDEAQADALAAIVALELRA